MLSVRGIDPIGFFLDILRSRPSKSKYTCKTTCNSRDEISEK